MNSFNATESIDILSTQDVFLKITKIAPLERGQFHGFKSKKTHKLGLIIIITHRIIDPILTVIENYYTYPKQKYRNSTYFNSSREDVYLLICFSKSRLIRISRLRSRSNVTLLRFKKRDRTIIS